MSKLFDRLKSSRPLRTFVQAFAAIEVPIVVGAAIKVHHLHDLSVAYGLVSASVGAALAAGLAAVMRVAIPPTDLPAR
jgi:hypothetical protein